MSSRLRHVRKTVVTGLRCLGLPGVSDALTKAHALHFNLERNMLLKTLMLAILGVGAATAGIFIVQSAAQELLARWRVFRASQKET